MNLPLTRKIFARPVFCIMLIAFLAALLVQSGDLAGDTVNRLRATHWIWTDNPQIPPGNSHGIPGRGGELYVWYGIGHSLLMLPLDIISTKLIEFLDIQGVLGDRLRNGIVSLTFIPISPLIVLIAYHFLQLLKFSQAQSVLGSLGLLTCTTLLHYTQVNQENSGLLLMTLSGYYLSYHWFITGSKKSLFFVTLAMGFNLLTRLTTLLDCSGIFLFLVSLGLTKVKANNWNWSILTNSMKEWAIITVPMMSIFLAIDRIYHWWRFESWTGTYIKLWGERLKSQDPTLPKSFPFNRPFWDGFFSPIIGSTQCLFLFDPLLILTFTMLVRFWKGIPLHVKLLATSFIYLMIAYLAFYARFYFVAGEYWGNRYVILPVQLLCLLALPLLHKFYREIKSGFEKALYWTIIGFAFILQTSSIVFWQLLEHQQAEGFAKTVDYRLILRFINIVAVATGQFEKWGLNNFPSYDPRTITVIVNPIKDEALRGTIVTNNFI